MQVTKLQYPRGRCKLPQRSFCALSQALAISMEESSFVKHGIVI